MKTHCDLEKKEYVSVKNSTELNITMICKNIIYYKYLLPDSVTSFADLGIHRDSRLRTASLS